MHLSYKKLQKETLCNIQLSSLRVRSHERRNELKSVWDFISVIFTEMKFQTGVRFLCEHNFSEMKWISTDSLDAAFNAHVRLKPSASMDFI